MPKAGGNKSNGVEVDEDMPILWEEKKVQDGKRLILKTAGNMPLRLLLFIGCVGTAVILFIGMFSANNVFEFVQDIWTVLFCLSLATVEIFWWTHVPRFLVLRLRLKLVQSFNFLTRAWGKGMLALYIGSIMMAKWEFLDIISGIYMLTVGVLLIMFGRYAEWKLRQLRAKHISFASMDKNDDGRVDIQELHEAANKAGQTMTDSELYLAFALLDTDGDGVVSVKEFEHYFNRVKFGV